jgi:hypothetical protein
MIKFYRSRQAFAKLHDTLVHIQNQADKLNGALEAENELYREVLGNAKHYVSMRFERSNLMTSLDSNDCTLSDALEYMFWCGMQQGLDPRSQERELVAPDDQDEEDRMSQPSPLMQKLQLDHLDDIKDAIRAHERREQMLPDGLDTW